MLNIFKKKRLHKKTLILVGVPYKYEDFVHVCEDGKSDFVLELSKQFRSNSADELWCEYRDTAESVKSTIEYARNKGAEVFVLNDCKQLQMISEYEIVILIAHHSMYSDEFDFMGNMVREIGFFDQLPSSFEGVIDMTSCYSSTIQTRMKMRMPNSFVIAVDSKSSLAFRMFMLRETIKILCDHTDYSYIDAINQYLELCESIGSSNGEGVNRADVVYLGKETHSTVYAPKSVGKDECIIAQVVIHKSEEADSVELKARYVDENTDYQNDTVLSLKVKRGDCIDVMLCNSVAGFSVDEDKQTKTYLGQPLFFSFIITPDKEVDSSRFVGKLKIYVNSQPVGDMVFITKILDKGKSDTSCASFDITPFDMRKSMEEAKQTILSKIQESSDKLKEQLSSCSDETGRGVIEKQIIVNDKCKELINKDRVHNSVKRVFISSTSDLSKYRDVVKSIVQRCEMFPEMYENWGQGNIYPRDLCCERVLQSDLFVLLLGPQYGYIEPEWKMSMTEIEYRTALQTGMPILVYLVRSFEKNISKLKKPDDYSPQERFVADVKSKRLVRTFEDEEELELGTMKELLLNR